MMKKRVKTGSAIVLALALAFSALPLLGAKAAYAVDTNKKCSVDFVISTDEFDEMDDIQIPVKLYKVASINKSGEYTAEAGFENVDFSNVEYKDGASAAEWEARAAEAAKLITKDSTPAATTTTKDGQAHIGDLATGLYLVMGEETKSANYTYNFKPYLISLPNNYYYTNGNDEWVYDLKGAQAIGLKPEQEERLGDLVIHKNLVDQNATMGEKATFVFEVAYTTPKGESKTKIVTLTFDAAGEKSATVKDIPAGSKVTVTEVYSGASYELISENDQTADIVADEEVGVSFKNAHNGKTNGGYGVVNNYKPDENGQYDWKQLEDNSDKNQ